MGGPGDSAPKGISSREQPTPLQQAEGHETDPNNVDLDPRFSPGSERARHVHKCLLHGSRETSPAPRHLWWMAGNYGKAKSHKS